MTASAFRQRHSLKFTHIFHLEYRFFQEPKGLPSTVLPSDTQLCRPVVQEAALFVKHLVMGQIACSFLVE